jgi:hypothetical protein
MSESLHQYGSICLVAPAYRLSLTSLHPVVHCCTSLVFLTPFCCTTHLVLLCRLSPAVNHTLSRLHHPSHSVVAPVSALLHQLSAIPHSSFVAPLVLATSWRPPCCTSLSLAFLHPSSRYLAARLVMVSVAQLILCAHSVMMPVIPLPPCTSLIPHPIAPLLAPLCQHLSSPFHQYYILARYPVLNLNNSESTVTCIIHVSTYE